MTSQLLMDTATRLKVAPVSTREDPGSGPDFQCAASQTAALYFTACDALTEEEVETNYVVMLQDATTEKTLILTEVHAGFREDLTCKACIKEDGPFCATLAKTMLPIPYAGGTLILAHARLAEYHGIVFSLFNKPLYDWYMQYFDIPGVRVLRAHQQATRQQACRQHVDRMSWRSSGGELMVTCEKSKAAALKMVCAQCSISSLAVKVCSRCGDVRYCSQRCQLQHWRSQHKQVCRRVSSCQ